MDCNEVHDANKLLDYHSFEYLMEEKLMSMEKRTIFTVGLLYIVIIDLLVIILALAGRVIFDWPPLYAFYPFFYGAQLALLIAGLAFLQAIYGLIKKTAPIYAPQSAPCCWAWLRYWPHWHPSALPDSRPP